MRSAPLRALALTSPPLTGSQPIRSMDFQASNPCPMTYSYAD